MSPTKRKNKKPVVIILGPTASGKSGMAVEVALKLSGEIISADSRQLYKGMDIGTGKITEEEKRGVPHYLLDIATPDHQIYLPQYQQLAFETIDKIHAAGKLPIIAGGTGLYLSAIVENYQIPNVAPQQKLREELEKLTAEDLMLRLKELDPEAAQLIYQNNKIRLIRAIEFNTVAGKSFFGSQKTAEPKHDYLLIGIDVERAALYERINQRVIDMITSGLEKEVKKLATTYGWDAPGLQSIGYREWQTYLKQGGERSSVIAEIQKDSRNYAKRQMTWFWRMEKHSTIHWVQDTAEALSTIQPWLKKHSV